MKNLTFYASAFKVPAVSHVVQVGVVEQSLQKQKQLTFHMTPPHFTCINEIPH